MEAKQVNYEDGMIVYPKGLTAPGIAAIRQSSDTPEDSGWRVFGADRIDWKAEPRALRDYEIAAGQSVLLSILCLLIGCSVRIEGINLVEAVSPGGKRVATALTIPL